MKKSFSTIFLILIFILLIIFFQSKPSTFSDKIDYEGLKNELVDDKIKNITFIDINSSIPKNIHKIYFRKVIAFVGYV